jgi:uncharacterized protein
MTNPLPITLVLGASENPNRYSNMAIQRLLAQHIPVIAVGLKPGNVHGIPIETAIPIHEPVDTLTLYVGPKHIEAWVAEILKLSPRRIIFNPGTYHDEVMQKFQSHGIFCEEACTLVLLGMGRYLH